MARRKKTNEEIRRELFDKKSLDKTSLAGIISDFVDRAIKDRRRGSATSEEAGIDVDLAFSVLVDVEDPFMDRDTFSEVTLFASRKHGLHESRLAFKYAGDTDAFGHKVVEPWEDYVYLELPYYIAATYTGYTMAVVEKHLAEIESGIYRPRLIDFNEVETIGELYLTVMKKYNKNLPEDVRLWLELR